MPIVAMPDGQHVSFPDDMPKEQIKGLIAAKFPQPQPKETGGAGAAFGEGLAGSIPFGNVITSGMGAGIAKLGGAEGSLQELYDQAQENTKNTAEAHPTASLMGNLTGIAGTLPIAAEKAIFGQLPTQGLRGAINAIPKGIAATGDWIRGSEAQGLLAKTGKAAIRSAKGAAMAAPTGALYGAGAAEEGHRLEGAKQGAGMAAAIGAASPAIGATLGYAGQGLSSIAKGVKARGVDALEEAYQGIKAGSSKAYKYMRDSGATFKPEATTNIVSHLEKSLADDGLLNAGLHGKTMSVLSDLKTSSGAGDFTLENLDQWRRLLGEVAGETVDGKVTSDARKASLLIDAIDNAVEGITQKDLSKGGTDAIEALNLGRAEYRKAAKFQTISNIIKKSDGDANYLKRELKKLADNPKKTRGFTTEEISALKDASTLSGGEGLLKMIGKFGFDAGSSRIGSGVGAVVGSGLAGAASGGTGAVLAPVVGTAARYGQKFVARGKAENLLKTIEGTQRNIPKTLNNIKETQKLVGQFGNSALGRFMAQNKDVPISSLKDIPPDVMQEIMKLPPAEAQKLLGNLKKIPPVK